ncbi:MAG: imidazolonepropionase [Anaerolineae bacterium]|nr:imidazolonepropionase [Anaerolineae bacterium]
MHVDLLITHAAQLLTLAAPGPRTGRALADLGLVEDGAVACRDGRIVAVGPTREVLAQVDSAAETLDARGRVVMPGFVDAHTHVVYAGDRAAEFEQRVQGATYLEIMAAGGGIMSTVRATRAASLDQLMDQTRARLDRMLRLGTTTVEAKTGYGLDAETERKMLQVIAALDRTHPLDLVPTYLGAHAVPAEYSGRADEFVDFVVGELAQLKAEGQPIEFVDVFCDAGAFTVEQSEAVLTQALALGYKLKIHADEFAHLGGASLAGRLGAVSADHLAVTPPEEMRRLAEAGVMGVLLPGTSFGLGHTHYADGRAMVEQGVAVALATDLNPGTCPCESMPFMIALACRGLRLSPAEAVVAATLNAAWAMGRGDRVGSLAVGKQADLLVLDTTDYRDLAYRFGGNVVQRVVKQGTVVV